MKIVFARNGDVLKTAQNPAVGRASARGTRHPQRLTGVGFAPKASTDPPTTYDSKTVAILGQRSCSTDSNAMRSSVTSESLAAARPEPKSIAKTQRSDHHQVPK